MTCVPLFIMVTGYLMKNKTYSKSYFFKLFPILGMYIICAAIYTFFDKRQLDIDYLHNLIENIFSFSHYSWYVNMYIGLYLLIPLLNNGFRSLSTKKIQKLVLIILVVLTSFPSTLSIKNHFFEKVILFISNNTLPIYLLSVIGDNYWYPILMTKMGDFSHLFPYSFFIILSLFIQSVFLTVLLKTLMHIISHGIKKVKLRKI